MLGKLIGYETKAFGRIMVPLYIAMLAFALFTGLSIRFVPEDIMQGLPGVLIGMLYGVLMMAIIIMTCVLSVTRFYKNLLGQEGYLMFSLPTDTATLIVSKVISVLIWTGFSTIVAFMAIALSALGAGGIEAFRELLHFFRHPEILQHLSQISGVLILTVLMIIAGTAASIVRIYAGIAIGHQFNDHRILFSIVALIAFNIIGTIWSTAFNIIGTIWSTLLSTFGFYTGVFESLSRIFEADTVQGICIAQTGMIGVLLFQVALFGVLTWVLLDRRLNLE